MLAADVVARAIARGVFAATVLSVPGAMPSWKDSSAINAVSSGYHFRASRLP
jgi:hypothetical protein